MEQISPHLLRVNDSCNVYLIDGDNGAVCVDFGTGRVLELLARHKHQVDVLLTHHHRDQAQGLPLAVAAGARIWAPHAERELFAAVEGFWQRRELWRSYNPRQDRFALLASLPLAGTLQDYAHYRFAGYRFEVVPTPGHTLGSLSLLAEIDGRRVAFTGDLIAAPGQIWSLAATQWTYNTNGGEGLIATILSLLDLKRRQIDLLLPAHGAPISAVDAAIDLTVERLSALLRARDHNPRLFQFAEQPYLALSKHLLWNRTSLAYSYVLRSQNGAALLFDFGHDFAPSPTIAAGTDRAARRPWLYTLPALKTQHGVRQIEAAIPTHCHDDHVAGLNLLRAVEGTALWAATSMVDVLEHPANYNLPCLWPEPITVDRALPLGVPIGWHEYELTLYPLPGHARRAVAIALEVDGRRVLLAGDQYSGGARPIANYIYAEGFEGDEYVASAALFRRLDPQLILNGHAEPLVVPPGYFDYLDALGAEVARLHAELVPPEATGRDSGNAWLRIEPYQTQARLQQPAALRVFIRNPLPMVAQIELRLVLPAGWHAQPATHSLQLEPDAERTLLFEVIPANITFGRTPIGIDIIVNEQPFGQQAEALFVWEPTT